MDKEVVRHRLPPLNEIRAFEAVTRHRSFHRAAEELHVTPSAVSHQVRSLEESLGVSLFHRVNRQVVLTKEGEIYLPPIRDGLVQIKTATQRVAASLKRGPLTMNVESFFASSWLVQRLSRFQEIHPGTELYVIASVETVDFSQSDVDLAIRCGDGHWPGLCTHYLMSEILILVCSPVLLEGPKALGHPNDLRDATLLHVLQRTGEWQIWLSAAGMTGVDVERGPRFDSTLMALAAAMAGLGVAIADQRLVARELRNHRLVAPFDIAVPSKRSYHLVYPEEYADSPKVAAFRGWLLAEVEADNNKTHEVERKSELLDSSYGDIQVFRREPSANKGRAPTTRARK